MGLNAGGVLRQHTALQIRTHQPVTWPCPVDLFVTKPDGPDGAASLVHESIGDRDQANAHTPTEGGRQREPEAWPEEDSRRASAEHAPSTPGSYHNGRKCLSHVAVKLSRMRPGIRDGCGRSRSLA